MYSFIFRGNALICFVRYPGEYSGYTHETKTLTSRNINDTVEFIKINDVYIMENSRRPVDVFNMCLDGQVFFGDIY